MIILLTIKFFLPLQFLLGLTYKSGFISSGTIPLFYVAGLVMRLSSILLDHRKSFYGPIDLVSITCLNDVVP